jgi:hypothetical protein
MILISGKAFVDREHYAVQKLFGTICRFKLTIFSRNLVDEHNINRPTQDIGNSFRECVY